MGQLKQSKTAGNILKDLKRIQRADLLTMDDFALSPFDNTARSLLMDVIDDRYDTKAAIFASQIPVKMWHDAIGEAYHRRRHSRQARAQGDKDRALR